MQHHDWSQKRTCCPDQEERETSSLHQQLGPLIKFGFGDTIENSALLKHTIDNTFELTNLVKRSPNQVSKLKEIQNSLAAADDCDNEDY